MAKQITCPLCGDKHQPDGDLHPNHYEPGTQNLCPLSIRPIEGHENDGPVVDGQGPAAL